MTGRILAMFRISLLQILRDRGAVFSLVVLPLILTGVFSVAFGGAASSKVRVLFVDEDRSAYAEQVREILEAEPGFRVDALSRSRAVPLLQQGEAALAVVVPRGFGRELEHGGRPVIRTLTSPGSTSAFAAAEVVRGAADRISADMLAVRIARRMVAEFGGGTPGPPTLLPPGPGGEPRAPSAALPVDIDDTEGLYALADDEWEPEPPVVVEVLKVTPSQVRGANESTPAPSQYSMGFVVMFVLFIAVGGSSGILEEREMGTLRRLLVTPTPKAVLLGGKVASVFGLCTLQVAMLVGFGAFAFGVPWGRDPVSLLAVIVPYLLAATGLGVMATSLVRSREQLSGLTPILATGLAMLGGCYWQVDIMPPLMQQIALLTPTGWAMRGLTDVVARSQGLGAAVVPGVILLAFAVVFFGVGLRFLKFE